MGATQQRRARRIALGLLAAMVLLGTSVGIAAAQEETRGNVVVEEGETVDSVDAVAGTVVVRGTVTGDVEVFAGSVQVAPTGDVGGDVDATAGSIRIDGTVDGTVRAVGGSVDVGETAQIGGDLEAGAGSVYLDGAVGGEVRAAAGSVTLGPNTDVTGDVRYDTEEFSRADGATVGGEVVHDSELGEAIGGGFQGAALPWWLWPAFGFLASLLLGAVLLALLPLFSADVAQRVRDDPLPSGGVGLLVLVGVPILLALLAITIVGIPLALLGIGAYVAVLWIGSVYGQYAIGAWALGRLGYENRWLALVVGLLGVTLLGAVPYVGGLVELLVLLLGLGAFALGLWNSYRGRRRRTPADERQTTLQEATAE